MLAYMWYSDMDMKFRRIFRTRQKIWRAFKPTSNCFVRELKSPVTSHSYSVNIILNQKYDCGTLYLAYNPSFREIGTGSVLLPYVTCPGRWGWVSEPGQPYGAPGHVPLWRPSDIHTLNKSFICDICAYIHAKFKGFDYF